MGYEEIIRSLTVFIISVLINCFANTSNSNSDPPAEKVSTVVSNLFVKTAAACLRFYFYFSVHIDAADKWPGDVALNTFRKERNMFCQTVLTVPIVDCYLIETFLRSVLLSFILIRLLLLKRLLTIPWHFQSDSVSRWIFRKSLTSPSDDPPRCVCTPMYGIGVRTARALLLVVYVRYWNRIQRDPWPIANIREFTKSTTVATNRSIFYVHPTVATSKRTSSHLHQHSPLSFTTNCVSAARPTRRRRAQSDLVSISRFFENGTQQLPNILEQNVVYSAQSSMVRLNKDALRNTQLSFLSNQQASHAWPLTSLEAIGTAAACGCVVVHSLAGRRHEWVYSDSLFLKLI